jgi:hypothetical protein
MSGKRLDIWGLPIEDDGETEAAQSAPHVDAPAEAPPPRI